MSAASETLDAGSGLLGAEEEKIDESKLSWLQRRRLNKQRKAEERKRKAAEKEGQWKKHEEKFVKFILGA